MRNSEFICDKFKDENFVQRFLNGAKSVAKFGMYELKGDSEKAREVIESFPDDSAYILGGTLSLPVLVLVGIKNGGNPVYDTESQTNQNYR